MGQTARSIPRRKVPPPIPVGPYFANFLSYRHKLIIEVDGEQQVANVSSGARRTAHFETQGFTVIRFWNHDVLKNPDGILQTIAARVNDCASHALKDKIERRHP